MLITRKFTEHRLADFYALSICMTAVILVCCSCSQFNDYFRDPDISPVRKVLKTAMPISYAANLTMSALEGNLPPDVQLIRSGDSSDIGCFLVHIGVDDDFPFPAGIRADGHIIGAGFIARERVAMMSLVFTELNVLEGSFAVADVSTFPVVRHEDIISGKEELIVVYADLDVNSGSDTLLSTRMSDGQAEIEFTKYQTMLAFDSGAAVEQNAWIIRVEDGGTAGEVADDKYYVTGGGQYVEAGRSGAEVVQATMFDALMTSACRRNPIEGYAFIQNIGASKSNAVASSVDIGHVFLMYHKTCDGCAEIPAATGMYLKSSQTSVPLSLDE